MIDVFDDHGIRFVYPTDWNVEVDTDGEKTTVSVHCPDGVAFAMVALDESCPEPSVVAGLALDAMQQEYPDLDSFPVIDSIDGHAAVGHDVEFMSLDAMNSCVVRCFRTDRRTVLFFGQWSDLEGEETAAQIRSLRSSIEETDS
jgi:hypothetical protein